MTEARTTGSGAGPVRRRTFLVWAISGVVAALIAAIATVIGVFLIPRNAPAVRLPKRLADLQDGDVIPIQAPSGWSLVMADGGGANKAGAEVDSAFVVRACGKTEVMAASCSHLGCTLDYASGGERFECPCHGSRFQAACSAEARSAFSLDGGVVHGPAQFPMAHIHWAPAAQPDELTLEMVPARPRP